MKFKDFRSISWNSTTLEVYKAIDRNSAEMQRSICPSVSVNADMSCDFDDCEVLFTLPFNANKTEVWIKVEDFTMDKKMFASYVRETFCLDELSDALLDNILNYVESRFEDVADQRTALKDLLSCFGFSDNEFNCIKF